MDIYLDIYKEEMLSLDKNLNILQEDLLYIQRNVHNISLDLKNKKDKKFLYANFIKEKCRISRKLLKEIKDIAFETKVLIKNVAQDDI